MTGRVLVVDAVSTNRIVLKVKLTDACYEVLQAASGRAGLEVARRELPDLILIAPDLPDIDGVEVCRRLRADAPTRTIPIVMLTAGTDAAARLAALAAGADDFLSKPCDDQVLLARLRSLLRAREAEAELSLRETTGRELGFAEPETGFVAPALIALVAGRSEGALRWRSLLAPLLPHRLVVQSRAETLADTGPAPDVFVIAADLDRSGDGLRLLSDLRSRAPTRHSGICIALPGGAPDLAATAFDLGANDLVTLPFDPQELALRIETLVRRKRLMDRLRASVRDELRASVRDPLTGLFNRRYALPHFARVADRAHAAGKAFAVMVLDLDRFKAVNDRWGHAAGDAVLVEVARRLGDNLRAVDLLARIGGEEFLVVMPDTGLAEARGAAERLCRIVEQSPFALPGGAGMLRVTLSIGLAVGGVAPEVTAPATVAEVLTRADLALLTAKAEGRNKVTVSMNAA
ncbi:MAG: diguanylate cyclase [Rhodobacteraceae bacterium]|nr:diguanylate cyclase [Paracoccaceae bacterium]